MEKLTNYPWLIYLSIFFVLLYVVLRVVNYVNRKKYEKDIAFLESIVNHWIVSNRNCQYIEELFDDIFKNNQDKKRTAELWGKFTQKYYKNYSIDEEGKRVYNKEVFTVLNKN